MKIRFGVHTGQQDVEMAELRRLWRFADTSGFDWISVWDHIYEAPPINSESPVFEAVACMATLAADTQNVRVGCLVFCMGYRNPALLAKSLVTIDHVSGGRLEVGLGGGWHEAEHVGYGYPFPPIKTRLDMLEEGIQVIRMLFTQERSDFQGKHYTLSNAACYPKPVQRRVPIIVGGRGEKRTLRIAARYADGWNAAYISPEEFRHKSQVLDQWCEKEGRDPTTIDRTINVGFYMGADARSAERVRHERLAGAPGGEVGHLVGTPAEAIERVGQYAEAGASRINIAIRPPVDWEALEAYVKEVMPAFS